MNTKFNDAKEEVYTALYSLCNCDQDLYQAVCNGQQYPEDCEKECKLLQKIAVVLSNRGQGICN